MSTDSKTSALESVRRRRRILSAGTLFVIAMLLFGSVVVPTTALAARGSVGGAAARAAPSGGGGLELEAAAEKAGNTGRKIAMSLIGLAFAIAAIILAFRRDFKEAVGVLAIGSVAVFLANATGLHVLEDTVKKLFGS